MIRSANEIKTLCLRWLAAREYSKKELQQKLAAKGIQSALVDEVINELAESGYQNDSRFAESFARSRILKGYGPVRIEYELQQKGIDCAEVNLEAIVETESGGWMALLEDIYYRKFDHNDNIDLNEWAKRSRFLYQRGFTGTMISDLLKHLHILRLNR